MKVEGHREEKSGAVPGEGEKPDGKFFYAVIHAKRNRSFGDMGIEGARVYSVRYLDVAALVSDYPHDQVRMLRKNLSPYQLVLRKAGDNYTTLPAKFGQIAGNEDEMIRVLKDNYSTLKSEINKLHDKKEFGLVLFWSGDDFFKHLVNVDRGLKTAASKLYNRPSPSTQLEQIEFGRMVRHTMNLFKRRVSERVVEAVRDCISEHYIDEPTEDKMIMNGAFLIHKERYGDFREAMEKIAAQMAPDFEFKLSGPWAPFCFVRNITLF